VTITPGGAAIINDQAVTARTATVLKAAFGNRAQEMPTFIYASEDFSVFLNAGVPDMMLSLGMTDPRLIAAAAAGGPPVPVNHSPLFAPVPEPTIKTGVEAMTLAVMGLMEK
jgi:metal-dependent amidase/aminoacylase/carboxypeptidase family protein